MKIDKRLRGKVAGMVRDSFDKSGKLVEKKAEGYINELKSLSTPKAIVALSEYLKGVKREMKKSALEIETAIELSEPQIKEITKSMEVRYQINEVKTNLNSSLFGGIRIKIGDVVLDDSVSRRIAQVKEVILG